MVASSLQHDAATVAGAVRACTTIVDYDELLKRVSDTKFVLIGEAIEKRIAQRFNAGISITLSRSSPDRGDRRVLSSPDGTRSIRKSFSQR